MEKNGSYNKQFKISTEYKTFNHWDLIRNQHDNFRHQNNRDNLIRRFQNKFDRRNHFENKNPSIRPRKQPSEIQENEKHQNLH